MLQSPDRDQFGSPFSRRHNIHSIRLTEEESRRIRGFTLIELVVVLSLIGMLTAFATWRLGSFAYWREESFIRRFSETIVFLHHQAVFDQIYYALEIDLQKEKHPVYRIGVLNPEYTTPASGAAPTSGTALSQELSLFLNPTLGDGQTLTPSTTFPSLANPVEFPDGMYIEDIRTMRGKHRASEGGKVYVMFSQRGFSEFAVFHLRTSQGAPITILVNPFTGTTDIIRDYKDFEWSYGRKKS